MYDAYSVWILSVQCECVNCQHSLNAHHYPHPCVGHHLKLAGFSVYVFEYTAYCTSVLTFCGCHILTGQKCANVIHSTTALFPCVLVWLSYDYTAATA